MLFFSMNNAMLSSRLDNVLSLPVVYLTLPANNI